MASNNVSGSSLNPCAPVFIPSTLHLYRSIPAPTANAAQGGNTGVSQSYLENSRNSFIERTIHIREAYAYGAYILLRIDILEDHIKSSGYSNQARRLQIRLNEALTRVEHYLRDAQVHI